MSSSEVPGFCHVCGRQVTLRQQDDAPHCTMCGSDVVELADPDGPAHAAASDDSNHVVELLSSTDSVLAAVSPTASPLDDNDAVAETSSAKPVSGGGLFTMLDDIVDALVVSPLNALSGAVGLGAAAPHEFRPPPASAKFMADLVINTLESDEQVTATRAECAQCAVCMCAFERGDRVVRLLCRHPFHDDCVLPWLRQTSTCPSCRFQLPTDDRKFERRKKH